ncbi:PH domain-containing protein [Halohasta litorea]|uniref:PH domain-containing protein n=1 Tax=Halohasta litorea TaxID=869891 RepID=A0ABD6DB65_9EURY|nr:PH domain-containing protein [Halohasta litorea]
MSSDTGQTPQVPETKTESTAAVDLDWLTLDDGEEVLWASTPHKSSLVSALVVGIPLSFVLVGIPILAAAYLSFKNTNYVVTTRGLYRKRGIFSRDVKQIGFDKVQNISYSQTAIGARLGYGSVEISTAGSSGVELQFRNIPTPAEIQELISREIERREDGGRDNEGDVDDTLEAILTELQGIRQALDGEATSGRPEAATDSGTGASTDGETSEADPFEPAVTEPTDDQ